MSDKRVKFSTTPPLKGVLKHSEPHPRDSGVGSSSSDHTGSSGSLDERFTARDYDIQSNNVDALREALADAIKDIDQWKNKYAKKNNDYAETRKSHRETEARYRDACERAENLQGDVDRLEERMANQDRALEIANEKIDTLESELAQWKDRYKNLDDLYESVRHSTGGSMVSGSSGEHSLAVGRTRSQMDRDSEDLAYRMKERMNRDQSDSSSSQATRGSRNSDATASSRRPIRRAAAPASDEPYIEKLPRSSNTSLTSPRQPGNYTLTTAEKPSSRRHAMGPSSRLGHREAGDYVAHPLPDYSKRLG
ncbi:hypothetical protein F4777DRAFT_584016 [Nemania sp. FL0916]|nr:hypothetical protein F4777DRAFT_584016 [Nemania sp. FL0916]